MTKMQLSCSEKEYLAAMYQEFGCIFGSNEIYGSLRQQCKFNRSRELGIEIASIIPFSRLRDEQKRRALALRVQRVSHKEIQLMLGISGWAVMNIQRQALQVASMAKLRKLTIGQMAKNIKWANWMILAERDVIAYTKFRYAEFGYPFNFPAKNGGLENAGSSE